MQFFRRASHVLCLPVAAAFLFATLVTALPFSPAQAGLVTTEQVIAVESVQTDRARIAAFIDRSDVREQLAAFGVAPGEAKARVAALSDAEVARIAGRIDALPAGEGIVSTLIGIVIVALVVLFITDLLGLTNVFPFVQPPAAGSSRR